MRRTSIEGCFLRNLLIDSALLALTARCLGLWQVRRALPAALFGAMFGVCAALRPRPLAAPHFVMLAGMVMALLLCGRRSARRWPAAALLLFAGAALTGGVGMLPVRGVLPPCRVAAGLAGFAALLPLRRRLQTTWRVGVRCAYGGHNVRFSALIDTGNRLREPLSGLPVMIVEKRLLPHCPPREDCRQVAYGALSGNGTLQCFRPDAVWIETRRGERRAPEVWVAVFPRALPCAESALAPGEFALIR